MSSPGIATQAAQPDSEAWRGSVSLLGLLASAFAGAVVFCVGGLARSIRRRPSPEDRRFRRNTSDTRESTTLLTERRRAPNGERHRIDYGGVRACRARGSDSSDGGGDCGSMHEPRRRDESLSRTMFSPWFVLSGALGGAFYAIIAGGVFRGVLREFFLGNNRFASPELRFTLAMMFALMFLLRSITEILEARGFVGDDRPAFTPLRPFNRLLGFEANCEHLHRSAGGVGISFQCGGFLRRSKVLKTWGFPLVLMVVLGSQATFVTNRRYWARKAVDAWVSPCREAFFNGVESFLLLRFPRGAEAGIVVAALMAAAKVRSMAEKMAPAADLPCISHGAALTCLEAFGGELLASTCIGIRAMILTEELALPSAVAAWMIVGGRLWGRPDSFPFGLRGVLSFVGVHHALVVFAEIFRAFLVCRAVDSARGLAGAGGSWALAVVAGVLAGSGGLFLPGNRGLSPLFKKMPWAMQSSAYGAALYYLAGSTQPAQAQAQAVVALFFSVVALARTFRLWGPEFKFFSPIHGDAYCFLSESVSPPTARATDRRRPEASEAAMRDAAEAAVTLSAIVRRRVPGVDIRAPLARPRGWPPTAEQGEAIQRRGTGMWVGGKGLAAPGVWRAVAWVAVAASLIAFSRWVAFSQQLGTDQSWSPHEREGHPHEAAGMTMLDGDGAVKPSRGASSELLMLLALLRAHSHPCWGRLLLAADGGEKDARSSPRRRSGRSGGGDAEKAMERGSSFSSPTPLFLPAVQVRSEVVREFSEISEMQMGEMSMIDEQGVGVDVSRSGERDFGTVGGVEGNPVAGRACIFDDLAVVEGYAAGFDNIVSLGASGLEAGKENGGPAIVTSEAVAEVVMAFAAPSRRNERSADALVGRAQWFVAHFGDSCPTSDVYSTESVDAASSDSHACENNDGAGGFEAAAIPSRFPASKPPSSLVPKGRPWGLPDRAPSRSPLDGPSLTTTLKYITPDECDFLRDVLDAPPTPLSLAMVVEDVETFSSQWITKNIVQKAVTLVGVAAYYGVWAAITLALG